MLKSALVAVALALMLSGCFDSQKSDGREGAVEGHPTVVGPAPTDGEPPTCGGFTVFDRYGNNEAPIENGEFSIPFQISTRCIAHNDSYVHLYGMGNVSQPAGESWFRNYHLEEGYLYADEMRVKPLVTERRAFFYLTYEQVWGPSNWYWQGNRIDYTISEDGTSVEYITGWVYPCPEDDPGCETRDEYPPGHPKGRPFPPN